MIHIYFPWIGPPKFNTTGHDIIGPVLLAQAINKHAEYNSNSHKAVLACQKKYYADYKYFFSQNNISVSIVSYEDLFETYKSHTLVEQVKLHYEKAGDSINECIPIKNMLSLLLTYVSGGYVFDTNVIPNNNYKLSLPKPAAFTCPRVLDYSDSMMDGDCHPVYEVWGYASYAKNKISEKLLKEFLQAKENIDNLCTKQNILKDYRYKDKCAEELTTILKLNKENGLFRCWETIHDEENGIYTHIESLGLTKLYFNVHKPLNLNKSAKALILSSLNYCIDNNVHPDLFNFMVKTIKADITGEDEDGWSLLHNIILNIAFSNQFKQKFTIDPPMPLLSKDNEFWEHFFFTMQEEKNQENLSRNNKIDWLGLLLSSSNPNLTMLANITTRKENFTPLHLCALSAELKPEIFRQLKRMRINIHAKANLAQGQFIEENKSDENDKGTNWQREKIINMFNQLGIYPYLKDTTSITVEDILVSRNKLKHPNAKACLKILRKTPNTSSSFFNLEHDIDKIINGFDDLIHLANKIPTQRF